MKLIRASIVFVASLCYLAYVFRATHATFWNAGMGDWMDPYFINYLLEHWRHSLWTSSDPSSPPMYHPALQTLGYSHGLVLYAPFYTVLRLFLHPFQAYNLALFVVLEVGILCLYVLFRRCLELSFVESVLWSAFFFSSQNVINGATSIWSQRASVFLIPPILLMLVDSARTVGGPARLAVAWLGGFLASLLFTQDFYTGQFALFFAGILLAAVTLHEWRRPIARRIVHFWNDERRAARVVLVAAALMAVWTCYVGLLGGGSLRILGVRVASHDWRRPAVLTLAALAAFTWLRGRARTATDLKAVRPRPLAVAIGAAAGAGVFLWIYLGAYREHPAFPDGDLASSFATRDLARWKSPLVFLREVGAYDTMRSFELVFAAALLAWMPWFRVDRKARIYWLWIVAMSIVVLLVPLRFDGFSIWTASFQRLPGFGVIRDPKRIIYLYELAVVVAGALLIARTARAHAHRIATTVLLLVLLVTNPNREVFVSSRPIDVYERWVAAPIAIDRSCRSFFVTRASESYTSRSPDAWTLYSIDAMFVSLNHSIPTLNGYSAWFPTGWDLFGPKEADYTTRVDRWIERSRLTGVCQFDIEARTMVPYHPHPARR